MASRLVRTNAVTVNDVLDGRKLLEIDCVDRVYLTLSVPNLVVGGQVVSFLTVHEQNPIPSPVLLERRGLAFRRAVTSFAEANDIPVLSFAGKRDKGRPGVLADSPWPERKIDKVMPLMRKAAATGRSRVVAIGVAQEYQRVFTGTKDQTPTGAVWFSYNRTERRPARPARPLHPVDPHRQRQDRHPDPHPRPVPGLRTLVRQRPAAPRPGHRTADPVPGGNGQVRRLGQDNPRHPGAAPLPPRPRPQPELPQTARNAGRSARLTREQPSPEHA